MSASQNIDQIVDMARIDAQINRVVALLDVVIARINTLNQSGVNLRFLGGSGGGAGGGGLGRAATDAERLAEAMRRLARAESQAGADIATVNERIRQQNLANAQNARQTIAQAGSLNDLRARLAAATTAFDNMNAAQRRSVTGGQATIATIKQLQKEVRALEQETGRFQRNVGNYPKLVGQGAQSILGAFGIATGAAALGATAKAVFDTTVKIDSLNAALRAVSGSQDEFIKNQVYLVDLSGRLGLNILGMSQAYKLFYTSSTQAGLSADATREIFTSVAEASAVLKLSQDDTNGVLLAFSQIASKGKVQAEELRGQIGERLPGAFAIAARAMGVTQVELNKMLQTGQVISADFLPKFAAELKKTFGNGGEVVEGLQASINRLHNRFTELVSDNESGLVKFFTAIIDGATAAINVVNGLAQAAIYLKNTLSKTGQNANVEFIENSAYNSAEKEIQAGAPKLSTENLLKQRNIADSNIEKTTLLLESQKKASDEALTSLTQLRKEGFRTNGDFTEQDSELFKQVKAYDDAARSTEKQLQSLVKTREIYVSELRKRFPSNPDDTKTAHVPTAAEIQKASRLRELQLKAELDANKITIQEAIDSQKLIFDNEKFSYGERVTALDTYVRLKNKLVEDSASFEEGVLNENIKQGQAVEAQRIVIQKQAAVDQGKIALEAGDKLKEIAKNVDDEQIRLIMASTEKQKIILDNQTTDTLTQLKDLHDRQKISDEDYEIAKAQTQNKYEQLRIENEIDSVEKIIAIRKLGGQNVEEEENKIAALRAKARALDVEDFGDSSKKKRKISKEEADLQLKAQKQLNDELKSLARELVDFASTIINAGFEREKQLIDDQLAARQKATQAEIDDINRSTASQQEKADRIALINVRAAAEEDRLNEKKKQIELQQARFEKARSIAQVVTNTAAAIVKAFATFPFYLAAPIAAVIAGIGAAQLATIVATPLPRYKDGRDGGPAEVAVVGDGGVQEVVQVDDMAYLTPNKDTVTWLPKGAKVHKSVSEYKKAVGDAAMSPLPNMEVNRAGQLVNNNQDIVRAIEKNKTVVNVRATWDGLKTTAESAAGKIDYLNKNVYH